MVKGVVDLEWGALEYFRANGLYGRVLPMQNVSSSEEYNGPLADLKLGVVCDQGCSRFDEQDLKGGNEAVRALSGIGIAFLSSKSTTGALFSECLTQFVRDDRLDQRKLFL